MSPIQIGLMIIGLLLGLMLVLMVLSTLGKVNRYLDLKSAQLEREQNSMNG
jgi:hypothetical protein